MYDDGQVWRVKLTARRAWGLCWDGGRHRAEARQHATAAADNTQHRQFTTAINTALWWRHCAVSRSSSSAVSISLNLDCLAAVTNIRFGLHCFDSVGRRQEGYPILSKGPFIAMQLNSTWRRAELSAGRYRHFADANSTSSWVAYRHPHRRNSTVADDRQCNWVNWVTTFRTDRWQLFTLWTCWQLDVELSCVAINGP